MDLFGERSKRGAGMTKWRVAIVRVQRVEFGVVAVDAHILDDVEQREAILDQWLREFSRPVLLFNIESGKAYGRGEISKMAFRLKSEPIAWWSISLPSPAQSTDVERDPAAKGSRDVAA